MDPGVPVQKNKTSQETQRSLQKFLEPNGKPKVIYTDNSLEFGKACEDLSWNHCTSTPQKSETMCNSSVMFRVLMQAQQAKGGVGHCDSVCEGDRKEFCGYRWTGQSIVDRLAGLDSKFVTTTAVDDQTVLRTQTGE